MKGYAVLVASIIIQACLGGIYAWSAFVPSLNESYELTKGESGLIFGVAIATFTVAMVFAGKLLGKWGPRRVAAIGGILFGLGYLLASRSGGSYSLLLLGIGILGGSGIGFGYVCPLATCIRWFPTRKGMVSGLAVAGFGGGAIILAEGVQILLDRGMDVLVIFQWVGILYGTIVFLAAFFLFVPEQAASIKAAVMTSRIHELLTMKVFWGLVAGMFAGTFGGLLVVGNLKPMGMAAGLDPHQATLGVMALSIGNAVGRIAWGGIYDRLGWRSIPLSLITLLVGVLALLGARSAMVYLPLTALIGFGFGACFVLYVAQVATVFGDHRVGSIYPVVFLAYGVSGIIGPGAAGMIYDATNSYAPAIMLATGIIVFGLTMTLIGHRTNVDVHDAAPLRLVSSTNDCPPDFPD